MLLCDNEFYDAHTYIVKYATDVASAGLDLSRGLGKIIGQKKNLDL